MTRPSEKTFLAGTPRALKNLVSSNEEWLMERILYYATLHDFTKYTSTLKEPWRASIEGLSASLLAALEYHGDVPEFGPEEDWKNDPCGNFGRQESDLHRQRGVPLAMFLALMKYYRQSYIDLLTMVDSSHVDHEWSELFINRVFDRIEISFCQSWSGLESETMIEDLQKKNRLLANEKNKFLTLFESYSMPCFFVDHAGKLDCMNFAAAEIFGFGVTPGEHYYRPRKDEAAPAWLLTEIKTFMLNREDSQIFDKKYQRDNEELVFVVHFRRMLDVSSKFSGVVVSLADITQRIKDKEKIEGAHKNLYSAQEQIFQREKMASLGRLAAGMAHEINNPLASILQSLQVIEQRINPCLPRNRIIAGEEGIDMDALSAYLDRQSVNKLNAAIKESGAKAAAIVKQLFEHSNLNHQPAKPVDPRQLLEHAIKTLKSDLKFRRATDPFPFEIIKEFADEPLQVFCAPLELHQILVSIISNAVEAMSTTCLNNTSKKTLWFRLSQESGQVLIEIRDNGPGMSEEVRKNIFEPFFTTKEVGAGVGLGMSLVYKFVQAFNGTIEVDSAPDQGCRIILRFPACMDSNEQVDEFPSTQ